VTLRFWVVPLSLIKNGELLGRAADVCDVFVTLDYNLEYQQNIRTRSFGIVVVRSVSNRIADLTPHILSISDAISRVMPGKVEKAGL